MKNRTAGVILNTSGNLLGFCLIVITSLKIANRSESHFIDASLLIVAVLLIVATVLSYITLRRPDDDKNMRLQYVADYMFLFSLLGILVAMVMIALNYLV